MSRLMSMNTDRLKEIIDAYGANHARWPDAERDAALALLATSADLQAYRDAARTLDAFLDEASVAPASVDLETAILATAPSPQTQQASVSGWRRWISRPAFAAAGAISCMLVGAASGYALTVSELEAERAEAFLAFGYGETYADDDWLGDEG